MLRAGEDQFGGGERLAELARLLGDLPAIDGDEHRADDDGDQQADGLDERRIDQGAVGQCAAASRQIASAQAQRMANASSLPVSIQVCDTAEIIVGAISSTANGLARPPVRYSMTPSWPMSTARM